MDPWTLVRHVSRRGVTKSFAHMIRLGPSGFWQRLCFYGRLMRSHSWNLGYDLWQGTQTQRNLPRRSLLSESTQPDCAIWYTPVPVSTLRAILQQLTMDYSETTFIDYGCGKGRAMLVAGEFSFKAIVGIEFATNLIQQTQENVNSARQQRKQRVRWDIYPGDARNYLPPQGNCLFFLYAPFYGHVLDTVLENIRQACRIQVEGAVLCFVDDEGRSLLPHVVDTVSQWNDWQRIVLPPLPTDYGALYPIETAIYRKVKAHGVSTGLKRSYRSPALKTLGTVREGDSD